MHRQRWDILLSAIVLAPLLWMLYRLPSTSSASLEHRTSVVTDAVTSPTATATPATPTSTASPTNTPQPQRVCEWSIVPSPNAGTESRLSGIAAVSATDIWAVGGYSTDNDTRTLILRWDGTTWSVVSGPNVGTRNYLTGVAAASAEDIWAVGYYHDPAVTGYRTLILHWDGASWAVVPSPNPGLTNSLSGVTVVPAADVWAVGTTGGRQSLILHWDGRSWDVVSSPDVGEYSFLMGVTAVSANDVWAVGYYHDAGRGAQSLILHWDGTAWSSVPSQGSQLTGVAAISADDVWAVGYSRSYFSGYLSLILHWDGTSWRVVPSPDAGEYGQLNGVATVSADDVWAVGGDQTLILHWDGTRWSVVPRSQVGGRGYLTGVAAGSADEIWTVGYYASYGYGRDARTLTGRLVRPCVTPTPASSPTVTPTVTPTSVPGPPILHYPPDGAVLPQPVPPNEWYFSWTARMGPCYSRIDIDGPGGRRLGEEYGPPPYRYGSELRYSTDEYLPDDALGPWHWGVGVICPLGGNHSEQRTFWVEPAPFPVETWTVRLPLLLNSHQ